jgi:hypothetical protein
MAAAEVVQGLVPDGGVGAGDDREEGDSHGEGRYF